MNTRSKTTPRPIAGGGGVPAPEVRQVRRTSPPARPRSTAELTSVETLYEGIVDDDVFANLPARLARAAGARAAIIKWRHVDLSWEALAYNYYSPAFISLYTNAYAAINPWLPASLSRANIARFVVLDPHVSRRAFEESPFNRLFLAPLRDDTVHCASLALTTPCGDGVISLLRGRRANPFTAEDLEALDVLAPHLVRLLRVRGELASHRHGALVARDTLDSLGVATVVVRGDGRMVHANLVAEAILARRDGLSLESGSLVCDDAPSGMRLAAAISRATAANHPTVSSLAIDRGEGEAPYLVDLAPLGGRFRRSMALVTFRDPTLRDESLGARLRSLFGLTRAEAAMAVGLARGDAPAGARPRRGGRSDIVKAQLASIAAKMGCGRQSEIATKVASLSPAGV
jgi:PAS domain-containing protein